MRKYEIKRRITLAVASVVMMITASLTFAAPANAYIAGCAFGYSSVGAYAHCNKGDSAYYQVRVLCANRFTGGSRTVAGSWVPRGGQTPSVVSGCAWYEHFYGTPWAQGS